jgi:hypothetical protein
MKNPPAERGIFGKEFLQKVWNDRWDVRPVHAVVPVPVDVSVFLSEVDDVLGRAAPGVPKYGVASILDAVLRELVHVELDLPMKINDIGLRADENKWIHRIDSILDKKIKKL